MKKFLAVILSLALLASLSTSAFASEPVSLDANTALAESTVQPRIGHAGYGSRDHNGKSIYGTFTFSVTKNFWPMNEWTLKTTHFPDNAVITADLIDPNGRQVNPATLKITGNNELANKDLIPNGIITGTYTVRYNVWLTTTSSASGTIEVWVY